VTEEDVDKKDNGFGDGDITEDAEKDTNDLDSQGSDVKDDSVEAQVLAKCKVDVSMKMESVRKTLKLKFLFYFIYFHPVEPKCDSKHS